jgi:hypothetical protein
MSKTVTSGLSALAMALAMIGTMAAPHAAMARGDEDFDPASVDLVKLIECQTYDVPSYNGIGFWLVGDDGAAARKHLGLTEVESANFMLKEYRLATPITVFGRTTSRIAFNSSGPLAILDEADPHPLARQLEIVPAIDAAGKYLGDRVIAQTTEKVGDSTFSTQITLNVSTVTTHPGKVLAGCSYRIEVE